MKRAVLVILLLLLLAPSARAETLRELLDEPASYDGRQVSFRGEVIGMIIKGDHAWVNIFDNGSAIGVWCRAEEAREISFIGDYTHRGDIVAGTGIFHLACAEHGGDVDIHAISLTVSEKGHVIERPMDVLLFSVSALIALAAVLLSFYLWHLRKERRKRVPWPFY
jgi:hypothetical protein